MCQKDNKSIEKYIKNCDIVLLWGLQNIQYNHNNKKTAVIDPQVTQVATIADIHIQIAPRSDFYLAVILSRLLLIEETLDSSWVEKRSSNFEDYCDFLRTFRIKNLLSLIDISLDSVGDLLSLLHNKKVAIIVGSSIYNYTIGEQTYQAISSLAMLLGLMEVEHGIFIPYKENHDSDEKFEFLDDFEDDFIDYKKLKRPKYYKQIQEEKKKFWLLKSDVDCQSVLLHPSLGFTDGDMVKISYQSSSYNFTVRNVQHIREDCVGICTNKECVAKLLGFDVYHKESFSQAKVSLSKVLI